MPYRFFEGKPVGDSRLCATHWGPWREVLLLSNLHFTVTPPPHPQCSGIRPDSVRDTKVQLKTPFSHLERPTGRVKERGCRSEQNRLSPKINRGSPPESEFESYSSILGKAQGENFVTEGSRRAVGEGARESLRGWGGISAGLGVGSSSGESGACEPPPPRGRPLSSPLSIWGCRPLVAAASAASRAVPRQARAAPCPRVGGPLLSSSPPPPGSGRWDDHGRRGRRSRSQR